MWFQGDSCPSRKRKRRIRRRLRFRLGQTTAGNHTRLPRRSRRTPRATARHVRYPRETPLNNLWLSMLDRMDLAVSSLGDGTGKLPGLN